MILFFGPPGSGKSVQGKLLVDRNGWRWISTGELFRASKDPEVIERLASGGLVDDDMTNRVLSDALERLDYSGQIVLDGYPRNLLQAEWLMERVNQFDQSVDCVVHFSVPKEELVTRLTGRGRMEDTPEVVSHRLDIYNEKTKPVIDYFEKIRIPVLVINGVGDVQDVHQRIQTAVKECLQRG